MIAFQAFMLMAVIAIPASVVSMVPYRIAREASNHLASNATTIINVTTEPITTSIPAIHYHYHPDHHGNETDNATDVTEKHSNQTLEASTKEPESVTKIAEAVSKGSETEKKLQAESTTIKSSGQSEQYSKIPESTTTKAVESSSSGAALAANTSSAII